jgi:hypothetical protein
MGIGADDRSAVLERRPLPSTAGLRSWARMALLSRRSGRSPLSALSGEAVAEVLADGGPFLVDDAEVDRVS